MRMDWVGVYIVGGAYMCERGGRLSVSRVFMWASRGLALGRRCPHLHSSLLTPRAVPVLAQSHNPQTHNPNPQPKPTFTTHAIITSHIHTFNARTRAQVGPVVGRRAGDCGGHQRPGVGGWAVGWGGWLGRLVGTVGCQRTNCICRLPRRYFRLYCVWCLPLLPPFPNNMFKTPFSLPALSVGGGVGCGDQASGGAGGGAPGAVAAGCVCGGGWLRGCLGIWV